MQENLTTSDQALFEEVVKRGIAEGVANQEAYNQLVSDIIEGHRRVAELHNDQDLEGSEDVLEARWPEYQKRLNAREI